MADGAGATVSLREVTKDNLREIDYVRQRPGAREFFTSVVPGEGTPGPFYEKLGFAYTGELDEGERVMRKLL